MNAPELIDTARKVAANDMGLLATDESNPTCHKRFARLGIRQTGAARRAWRELIITTPGLGECISGADPPLRRDHPPAKEDGTPLAELASARFTAMNVRFDQCSDANSISVTTRIPT